MKRMMCLIRDHAQCVHDKIFVRKVRGIHHEGQRNFGSSVWWISRAAAWSFYGIAFSLLAALPLCLGLLHRKLVGRPREEGTADA